MAAAWNCESVDRSDAAGSQCFSKTIELFGSGCDSPSGFAVCSVRLSLLEPTSSRIEDVLVGHCANEGRVQLGEGCSHSDIVLEKCLRTMKRGERSVLLFDSLGRGSVKMGVTLDDFTEGGRVWTMDSDELVSEAIRLKEKGISLYRNDYRSAFVFFSRATKLLIVASSGEEEDRLLRSALASCHSNLAACQLLGEKYEHVVTNCNRSLEWLEPEATSIKIKVRYRRAVAFTALGEFERATADLDAILEVEPSNAAALRQRKLVSYKTAAVTQTLRVAMKKMFQ